jgi:FKBP-type peptidyl-prolyl cis-trans isomerase FkpA
MRLMLLFLPALMMAQTPATTKPPAAPAKAPAATSKAAPSTSAPKPATPAPKPAATAARPAGAAVSKAAPKPAASTPAPLTTDEQKTIYSIGLSMYRSLAAFDLTPAELELVKRALSDARENKPAVQLEEWGPKIQGLVSTRSKTASVAFLTKAAAEPGCIKSETGLLYTELRAGTGDSPKATDTVKVHYRGTLVNGNEFDSSYKRGQPAEFPLNGVIKCWTEGVQRMKVGGKSKLVCPSDLAYGDQGSASIPGGSTLIFEVELLDIARK